MTRFRPLIIATLICGACTPAPTEPNPEADRAAIAAVRAEFMAAYKAGDAKRAAALYEDDAVVMPSSRPTVRGGNEILAFETDTFNQIAVSSIDIISDHLQVIGDWAIDRGRVKATAAPKAGGPSSTDTGRYVIVLHRQRDGSWKVATDIDNK